MPHTWVLNRKDDKMHSYEWYKKLKSYALLERCSYTLFTTYFKQFKKMIIALIPTA